VGAGGAGERGECEELGGFMSPTCGSARGAEASLADLTKTGRQIFWSKGPLAATDLTQ